MSLNISDTHMIMLYQDLDKVTKGKYMYLPFCVYFNDYFVYSHIYS